jgi:hypothetical protein
VGARRSRQPGGDGGQCVVEVVDPGEDTRADADGGPAGSQQRGEFAVDVGAVVSDGRPRILATRGYRRGLGRVKAAATVHLDETESVGDTTSGHHCHPVACIVAGSRTG